MRMSSTRKTRLHHLRAQKTTTLLRCKARFAIVLVVVVVVVVVVAKGKKQCKRVYKIVGSI